MTCLRLVYNIMQIIVQLVGACGAVRVKSQQGKCRAAAPSDSGNRFDPPRRADAIIVVVVVVHIAAPLKIASWLLMVATQLKRN